MNKSISIFVAIITTSAFAFALPNQAFAKSEEAMQIFVKISDKLHVALNVEEAEITHEIQAEKVLAGHEEELGKVGSMSLGGGQTSLGCSALNPRGC